MVDLQHIVAFKKYKDERKITIGMSKKDIMNCRGKVKNAFYNCFAIIMRFKFEGNFREIHIKVFNTGKLGSYGDLIVDDIDKISIVYGVCDGKGDFLRKVPMKYNSLIKKLIS